MASDKVIKSALEAACALTNMQLSDQLSSIWNMGLSDRKDDDVKEAIVNFCKEKNDTFMVTPAQFMEFKKNKYNYL